jgi:uncharacterized integral membrane protein (TIGR00698 family)
MPVKAENHRKLSPFVAHDDWLAIWCGGLLLLGSLVAVYLCGDAVGDFLAKPGGWRASPSEAFGAESSGDVVRGIAVAAGLLGVLFAVAQAVRQQPPAKFVPAFLAIFVLATVAYVMAGHQVIKALNLEYALWALLVGLAISNTVGTPHWLRSAVLTEFYIKTGLVLLGAEVLLTQLVALGIPGIGVAWVVTPIVLITTYWFGQRVLRMPSRSLNMVISADMSVCGVSAAIATAAACRAKKEELSLAISLSLTFTVVMMTIMPIAIKVMGLDPYVGGAWLGGTIDSTGAVAAAGATLGESALKTAVTIKMIQNILIGVVAFGVAVYWTSHVENGEPDQSVGWGEIWRRFPKFVLGFMGASVLFSLLHWLVPGGAELTNSMIGNSTKLLRDWLFCLAFVCIGLDTNFRDLLPQMRGGKPLVLYVCGQSLNLMLTLIMAWIMFGVVFPPEAP